MKQRYRASVGARRARASDRRGVRVPRNSTSIGRSSQGTSPIAGARVYGQVLEPAHPLHSRHRRRRARRPGHRPKRQEAAPGESKPWQQGGGLGRQVHQRARAAPIPQRPEVPGRARLLGVEDDTAGQVESLAPARPRAEQEELVRCHDEVEGDVVAAARCSGPAGTRGSPDARKPAATRSAICRKKKLPSDEAYTATVSVLAMGPAGSNPSPRAWSSTRRRVRVRSGRRCSSRSTLSGTPTCRPSSMP